MVPLFCEMARHGCNFCDYYTTHEQGFTVVNLRIVHTPTQYERMFSLAKPNLEQAYIFNKNDNNTRRLHET